LLGGCETNFSVPELPDVSLDRLTREAAKYDLVIVGEPDPSTCHRLLTGPSQIDTIGQMPASVLIARQPRCPLRRMLLITSGYEIDDTAVDWTIRLAQPSSAAITVLAVAPDNPALCYPSGRAECSLADWLATDTSLGRQLRRIAQRLDHWGTQGILRFRQGPPDRQILCEVREDNYDLIVMAADLSGRWLKWLPGELVEPLLAGVDRPVLFAKSGTL
jgi:nucleotide-binding universal stress UspA family protein